MGVSPGEESPYDGVAAQTIEAQPVFGQIKEARGFRRFSFRGLLNVSYEWDLTCLTHNLLKIFRSGWRPARA